MAESKMKSLAKDTAIYGVSSILGRFLNWCLTPLHVYVFTNPVEYGKVSYIYGFTALFMILLTYGMETGFFRFMNKEDENTNRVYSTSLISLGATSLLFVVLCILFISPISHWMEYADHPDHIWMMVIVVAMDAFMTIPYAYLRYKRRPVRFATVRLIFIFCNILLNLIFLLLCPWLYKTQPSLVDWFYSPDYGIGYIFVANLISTLVVLIMLIPTMRGFAFKYFDFALLKRILKYSYPLLILGIAGVINQAVAQLTYPYLFDNKEEAFSQLGIYSACLKITLVIAMFTQAFRYAYEPFIFSQNKDQDNTQAYAQAMKYFIIFALLVFLGGVFYLDILQHFVSARYTVGISVVPIAMMGEIFFGIYFNLSIWYKLTDKTQFGAGMSILGCVITVLINILFVPIYGYIASAWAIFFCNLIIMIISYFLGQKYFPIRYELKTIGMYTLLTIILYFAGTQLLIDNEILRLLYRSALLVVFVVILVKKDLPLSQIPILNKYIKQ